MLENGSHVKFIPGGFYFLMHFNIFTIFCRYLIHFQRINFKGAFKGWQSCLCWIWFFIGNSPVSASYLRWCSGGNHSCSTSSSDKLILMSPSGHSVICLFGSWRDKLLLRCEVDLRWEIKTSSTGQGCQQRLSEAKSNRTPVALR